MHAENNLLEENITKTILIMQKAQKIAVLTGSGVSAESGIPTFRASDGLWEGHRIEEVATPEGFQKNPRLVWAFYNERRRCARGAQPNPGHLALAKLGDHLGERLALITQNVDGLHQRAGNRGVLELHGSLHRTRCTCCETIAPAEEADLSELPACTRCGGLLRPDIVWFHEALNPDVWENACIAVALCHVLLVIGTSAVVHPAASLIPMSRTQDRSWGKDHPATIIEINLATTEASQQADLCLLGPSGVILPQLIQGYLAAI